MMFQRVLLEKEQEELLGTLVEAARNVPRDQRQKFYATESMGEMLAQVMHQGLPQGVVRAYMGDIEMLGRAGLLALSYEQYSVSFDVTPFGFKYYEFLKQEAGQPFQQLGGHVRNYMDSEPFQRKYPSAYQKWLQAESLLWSSDSEQQLTTIGHLCREAIQEFSACLVNEHKPTNVDPERAHTVSRIRAVLDLRKDQLAMSERPVLDALLSYWGSVSDLIQRQEHGSQKEGKALVWKDARRVVFQTAVVMYEISSTLADIR